MTGSDPLCPLMFSWETDFAIPIVAKKQDKRVYQFTCFLLEFNEDDSDFVFCISKVFVNLDGSIYDTVKNVIFVLPRMF